MDRFVLRTVTSASTVGDDRIYKLVCGHQRVINPIPKTDSKKSRCYLCAADDDSTFKSPAPVFKKNNVVIPISVPDPIEITEKKEETRKPEVWTTERGAVPAVSYRVNAAFWRAECPFLPTRPMAHGATQEEAETKLRAVIAKNPDFIKVFLGSNPQYFTITG
jgi:hypothetical protein